MIDCLRGKPRRDGIGHQHRAIGQESDVDRAADHFTILDETIDEHGIADHLAGGQGDQRNPVMGRIGG